MMNKIIKVRTHPRRIGRKRIFVRRHNRIIMKNFGSKLFRDQIKTEVFSGPGTYIDNLSRLKDIEKTDPELKGSRFIDDPRLGSKITLRTIEKHPDLLKKLRGKDIFFYEPKDEKTPSGFTDKRTIVGINKRVIDRQLTGLDPITKTRKLRTIEGVLKHETTHDKQKKMTLADIKELGANLAMHTNIRKEGPKFDKKGYGQEIIDEATSAFFQNIEDKK